MSQLALNDVEGYAFPGHLHCMGVAQLVWSESSPYACPERGASKRDSDLRA